MSKGKTNYFRHSFLARHDKSLNAFMALFGRDFRDGYFYFFTLLELCAGEAGDSKTDFTHHVSVLRSLWRTSTQSVHDVCNKFTASGLLMCTQSSDNVIFSIPNLRNYTGKYEKGVSNKVKETKESKDSTPEVALPTPKKPRKKNLSKVQSQDFRNPKDSPELFSIEAPQLEEDMSIDQKASNVLTLFNALTFSALRPVPGNMKNINARLKEGYALEDFKSVIELKIAQWSGNPRMEHCIRPQTLFSQNFDSYLQEAKNAFKPKIDPLDDFLAQYKIPLHELEGA
jgi:uncharacterized phage protein (TIGR02220 family)